MKCEKCKRESNYLSEVIHLDETKGYYAVDQVCFECLKVLTQPEGSDD